MKNLGSNPIYQLCKFMQITQNFYASIYPTYLIGWCKDKEDDNETYCENVKASYSVATEAPCRQPLLLVEFYASFYSVVFLAI